ncbi:hypothetical protein [Arthrobacter monumenti]
MLEISSVYEERDQVRDTPLWTIDPEDDRKYTREPFGTPGDQWATVFEVELTYYNGFVGSIFRAFGRPKRDPTREPFGEFLQLRVCSPTFVDEDPRFLLSDGQHRALIQDKFSRPAVERYCRDRLMKTLHLRGNKLIAAWAKDFYIFDPDTD